MALRRPPTTFSDEISAADLAANSVGASELADNAVDSDAIAANAVTTAKIADSSSTTTGITPAKIAENAVTSAKIATGAVVADGLGAGAVGSVALSSTALTSVEHVKPHIQPGMLYPAMKDTGGTLRQTDGVTAVVASTVGPAGSTVASSLYGTVQSDGKMYYYTDIKGSKPIKDPRIGAHFGGQRYPASSYQELEEESGANNAKVFSVDGRDWFRRLGNRWTYSNGAEGIYSYADTSPATNSYFFEIVGYFNAVNYKSYTGPTRDINVFLDGTQNPSSTFTGGSATQAAPLSSRFVSGQSVINIPITGLTSPGIHTLKIANVNGDYMLINSIELLAQDTTSATTRSQIQIQPQNVVSYGKKFAVGITQSATGTDKKALHYNPFAFKTDGTTAWASGAHNGTGWPVGTGSSHNIDTGTSLGLAGWLHSSNYYKPYNGGRVVIWVDSSGNIKTSVTVMPPNARSILTTALSAKANASIANNTYLPTFEAGNATAYESTSLAETAKEFLLREYGNGSANGGTGSGDYPDVSMLHTTNDCVAYFMDDALTGFWSNSCRYHESTTNGLTPGSANDLMFFWFIGTGFSLDMTRYASTPTSTYNIIVDGVAIQTGKVFNTEQRYNIVQNLPYGTHVVQLKMTAANTFSHWEGAIIHQPQRPPIPENAVVLADYMLMADYLKQTGTGADIETQISKGGLYKASSRDFYYDSAAGAFHSDKCKPSNGIIGIRGGKNGNGTSTARVDFFGTTAAFHWESIASAGGYSATLGGSAATLEGRDNTGPKAGQGDASTIATPVALGVTNTIITYPGGHNPRAVIVDSPIHTSSHYQTFETPFLHELVGGDRNMEQTNLVVTADGKTWDKVTRDTSYLGPSTYAKATLDGGHLNGHVIWDYHRGTTTAGRGWVSVQKNIAYAYDRFYIF